MVLLSCLLLSPVITQQVSLQSPSCGVVTHSKHGPGQGSGGPGHQHYERQRRQDHGEGRQAAGPGEQGGTVTGRLPAVSGEEVVMVRVSL